MGLLQRRSMGLEPRSRVLVQRWIGLVQLPFERASTMRELRWMKLEPHWKELEPRLMEQEPRLMELELRWMVLEPA